MAVHVWQYYWGYDYLNNKVKNIYYGPKLDWMKEFKNGTTTRNKKRQSTNRSTRKIS